MTGNKISRSIPLTEKIPLYFVIIGLLSILVVGLFAFYSARDAMIDRTFDQLTSVRIEKQKRIEKLFEDASTAMQILCYDDPSIFNFEKLNTLEGNSLNPSYPSYLKLINSKELFSKIYIKSKSNVYEILPKTEEIKSYKASNISSISQITSKLKLSKNSSEKYSFIETDKNIYTGSINLIHNKSEFDIIVEINQNTINNIMMENNPHNGLGKSGEAYLVGKDHMLRSKSRFLDPSVRVIKVNTSSVKKAFNEESGIQIIDDYRGISVLSSFSPTNIPGSDWVILAEIDEKEAMIPISHLRIKIIVSSVIIALILLIISFYTSRQLIKPLKDLSIKAIEVGKGNYITVGGARSNDEIGDLTESFNLMVTELQSKEEALKLEKIKQLRSVIDGQEFERQRLSRELHDGLGQSLFGIKMQLENLFSSKEEIQNTNKDQILLTFDSTIDEVRRMSNNLKPAVLEDFGIANALKNLCMQYENMNFSIISSIDDKDIKLAKRAQTYLFRIAQEALNNITKHANPKNVSLNFYAENNKITLSIEDDGNGFDLEKAKQARGNGLNNMTERVNLLRGEININSVINRGTIVTITIPKNCTV